MKPLRHIACSAALALAATAGPAASQSFDFLGGVRLIGNDYTLGYGALTYSFPETATGNARLRVGGTALSTRQFGPHLSQQTLGVTGGYAWSVGPGGSFALMAGPVYVSRSQAGQESIDEFGGLFVAEYGGFVGERGYFGAYAEHSTPDDATFLRGFYSWYFTDAFGVGPDLSYFTEPGLRRAIVGVRASYVQNANVWSAILGYGRTRNTRLDQTDNSPVLELQVATRF